MVGREIGFAPDRGDVEFGEAACNWNRSPVTATAARPVCAVSAWSVFG
jgi:hypothetical protein